MNKKSKHHLATIKSNKIDLLLDSDACLKKIKKTVKEADVTVINHIVHDFKNGGFTLLFALAESHISIHTWPEHSSVQLDVFLCNYLNDNSKLAQQIFNEICNYFEPSHIEANSVIRK
jgi:S-adenosylmethionine decarboxylase